MLSIAGLAACAKRTEVSTHTHLDSGNETYRKGYVLPERVITAIAAYVTQKHGWEPELYYIHYLGHRDGLVYANVHHRDEDKDPSKLGSHLDFFVGIDANTLEIKREGKLD